MSGVINSVGSKSGVISKCELTYEEGTWNPNLRGSSGSAGSHAHNFTGQYTKIGNLITATGYGVMTNAGSWSGSVQVWDLPYTCKRQASNGSIGMYNSGSVDAAFRTIRIANNDDHIAVSSGAKLDVLAPWSEMSTGFYFTFTITYYCDDTLINGATKTR